jgi:hypothetical protein
LNGKNKLLIGFILISAITLLFFALIYDGGKFAKWMLLFPPLFFFSLVTGALITGNVSTGRTKIKTYSKQADAFGYWAIVTYYFLAGLIFLFVFFMASFPKVLINIFV